MQGRDESRFNRLRAQNKWDWSGALSDLERAQALDPANDTALRVSSAVLPSLGRVTEAIAQGRKATQIDPLAANSWIVLGDAMVQGGQLGPARVAYERGLKISPDHELARGALAFLDLLEGHPESALARVDHLPADSIEHLQVTAIAQHDLAHAAESRRALDLLLAKYASTSPSSIAEVYAWRGEKDLAFEWLERAYVLRDGGLGGMKVDPFLRNLRSDPRFASLLKKMNLPPD